MTESPVGMPSAPSNGGSSKTWIWLVVGGVLVLGMIVVVAVAAVFLAVRSGDADSDDGHTAAPPVPSYSDGPASPINVAGMPVDVVDGTVTSECFTFDMPSTADYEISPDSVACQVAVRPTGLDSLFEIDVMAQSGDNSIEYFFDIMSANMAASWPDSEFSTETVVVDGRPTGLAHAVNNWGVRTDYYQVPVEEGVFESNGTRITSILIVGPDLSSEDGGNQVLLELLQSFSVRD